MRIFALGALCQGQETSSSTVSTLGSSTTTIVSITETEENDEEEGGVSEQNFIGEESYCSWNGVTFGPRASVHSRMMVSTVEECDLACHVRPACSAWRASFLDGEWPRRIHCEVADVFGEEDFVDQPSLVYSTFGSMVGCGHMHWLGEIDVSCGDALQPRCGALNVLRKERSPVVQHIGEDVALPGIYAGRDDLQKGAESLWSDAIRGWAWSSNVDTGPGFLTDNVVECGNRCGQVEDCLAFTAVTHSLWGPGSVVLCQLHETVGEPIVCTEDHHHYIGLRRAAPVPTVTEITSLVRAFREMVSIDSLRRKADDRSLDGLELAFARGLLTFDAMPFIISSSSTERVTIEEPQISSSTMEEVSTEEPPNVEGRRLQQGRHLSDQKPASKKPKPKPKPSKKPKKDPQRLPPKKKAKKKKSKGRSKKPKKDPQRLPPKKKAKKKKSKGKKRRLQSALNDEGFTTTSSYIDFPEIYVNLNSVPLKFRLLFGVGMLPETLLGRIHRVVMDILTVQGVGGAIDRFSRFKGSVDTESEGIKELEGMSTEMIGLSVVEFPELMSSVLDKIDEGNVHEAIAELYSFASEAVSGDPSLLTKEVPWRPEIVGAFNQLSVMEGVQVDSSLRSIIPDGIYIRCVGALEIDSEDAIFRCPIDCRNGLGALWFEVGFDLGGGRLASGRMLPVVVLSVCQSGLEPEGPEGGVEPTSPPASKDSFVHGKRFDQNVGVIQNDIDTLADCHFGCESNDGCSFYSFIDSACVLSNSHGPLDDFRPNSATTDLDCESGCRGDPECTLFELLDPECKFVDEDLMPKVYKLRSGLSGCVGPTEMGFPGARNISRGLPKDSIQLAKAAPFLESQWISKDGTNEASLLNMEVPGSLHNGCGSQFSPLGDDLCVQLVQRRSTRFEAERLCSDMGAYLFTPEDAQQAELLCGILGCRQEGFFASRDVLWTGAQFRLGRVIAAPFDIEFKQLSLDVVDPFAIYDYEKVNDSMLGHCVLFDTDCGMLTTGTCDAYCLSPPSQLSTTAETQVCRDIDGNSGRLTLSKRPFVCAYSKTRTVRPSVKDEDTQFQGALISEKGKEDVCAMAYADVEGEPMWDYAEDSWEACAGGCRDIPDCQMFSFVSRSCLILKEEEDKDWPPFGAMTVMAEPIDHVSHQEQCDRLCLGIPECNIGSVAQNGHCYIKKAVSPDNIEFNMNQWNVTIAGPVDCAKGNSLPSPLKQVEGVECPRGFEASGTQDNGFVCVRIFYKMTTALEAQRICQWAGGTLAELPVKDDSMRLMEVFCDADRCTKRGRGIYDGIFYMGLSATKGHIEEPNQETDWRWASTGLAPDYKSQFAGKNDTEPALYNGGEAPQPDNTSGNQLCTYFYPKDHYPPEVVLEDWEDLSGVWGDEDCDSKCLVPMSHYQVLTNAPPCTSWKQLGGALVNLARFFVCTALPMSLR